MRCSILQPARHTDRVMADDVPARQIAGLESIPPDTLNLSSEQFESFDDLARAVSPSAFAVPIPTAVVGLICAYRPVNSRRLRMYRSPIHSRCNRDA